MTADKIAKQLGFLNRCLKKNGHSEASALISKAMWCVLNNSGLPNESQLATPPAKIQLAELLFPAPIAETGIVQGETLTSPQLNHIRSELQKLSDTRKRRCLRECQRPDRLPELPLKGPVFPASLQPADLSTTNETITALPHQQLFGEQQDGSSCSVDMYDEQATLESGSVTDDLQPEDETHRGCHVIQSCSNGMANVQGQNEWRSFGQCRNCHVVETCEVCCSDFRSYRLALESHLASSTDRFVACVQEYASAGSLSADKDFYRLMSDSPGPSLKCSSLETHYFCDVTRTGYCNELRKAMDDLLTEFKTFIWPQLTTIN